jgi:hypothetical protein
MSVSQEFLTDLKTSEKARKNSPCILRESMVLISDFDSNFCPEL